MRVSFLVTYFNQKQYVKKSIESILSINKDFEWEILVGDDGSTDGTLDEIQNYIDLYPDRIKLFIMHRCSDIVYHSVKRASANRLSLLSHAKGDFFCILDGDDFYSDKDFVVEAIEIFKRNLNVAIVAFGYQCYKQEKFGKVYSLSDKIDGEIIDTHYFLRSKYIHAGACVYKKAFGNERIDRIKSIGYFDDNDIVINSLCFGKLYAINKPVYAYRQTGMSVYTEMGYIEQAVLNVQGYDVDCNLAPQYKKELLCRNKQEILLAYALRHRLKKILSNKIKIYVNASETIPNSIVSDILNYDNLQKKRKDALDLFIAKLAWKYKRTTLKILLRCLKGL